MQTRIKHFIGLGLAAAAGYAVANHALQDKYDKKIDEMRQEQQRSQYQYVPNAKYGIVHGTWQEAKAKYMATYGRKVISIADKHVTRLLKLMQEYKQSDPTYLDYPDIVIGLSVDAITETLIRNGNAVDLTGQAVIPFIFLDFERFVGESDLAVPYTRKRAIRSSSYLTSKQAASIDLKTDAVIRYIGNGWELIKRELKFMQNDLNEIGVTAEWTRSIDMNEPLYTMIVFKLSPSIMDFI